MTRKKIVLVIVEGASDETTIGVALSRLFDRDAVYIHIMHGDITTRKGMNPKNIIAKLGNDVTAFAKSGHYSAKDFKQIIHIVDTDGAYIPDEKVIEEKNCEGVVYEADGIHTANARGIVARNLQKRENLFRLKNNGKIWNIPYRVYYMSCNLDHVLHDKRNSTDEEKESDAYAFARKYKNDVDGFVEFVCNSEFSINGDYKESWDHIEKDMNSINRYSNFAICIQEEFLMQQSSDSNQDGRKPKDDRRRKEADIVFAN